MVPNINPKNQQPGVTSSLGLFASVSPSKLSSYQYTNNNGSTTANARQRSTAKLQTDNEDSSTTSTSSSASTTCTTTSTTLFCEKTNENISSGQPPPPAVTNVNVNVNQEGVPLVTKLQTSPIDTTPGLAGAIAPTALLVGGTAAMYHSLLHHPSSTLTPLSILYMLLLAIQTSVQPRLSKKYISKQVPKVKVALVEEVIKTSVATLLFFQWTDPLVVKDAVQDWTLSSSLLVAGVPATLYAVQAVLTYLSHQHLDSVTFNGLSQTKTLTAAFCCYLVMGKKQSPLQIVALAMLFVSAMVFQSSGMGFNLTRLGRNKSAAATAPDKTTNEQDTTTPTTKSQQLPAIAAASPFLWYGVVPCLGATFLSGLAGAFSQRGLQIVGGNGRNAFLYTVEVSFFSALTLFITQGFSMLMTLMKKQQPKQQQQLDNDGKKETDSNHNWTWQALIPITSKAMGGILTALVHKHAGSVVKGFALMLGLVMSGILQSLWFGSNDDDKGPTGRLPANQVVGILIVMLASWLHVTNPPV
ncbi:CMP-sialic acid transporter 5 [Seminavis robusta]|uniref:CMP-sialic acid transporter 5 n=1 Tax=Seminavis robusta TaxID=568900 RepID=A0A9N8DXP3_9STRA|nr:CMP-sialic acid transporter 5 [Seminavis robusta]|eukprot:Sro446_g144690.1 CMP-sialic acid transporter 5 (527) ;mRNA; r:40486-42187